MDGLNDIATLSDDDIALIVGRLTLDNKALRNEIARLQRILSEGVGAAPSEAAVMTE